MWAYENVLLPLAGWVIEDAAPATLDTLTSAFETLTAILSPVIDAVKAVWDALTPVISWIGDVAIAAIKGLGSIFEKVTQVFNEKGPEIENIISNIKELIEIFWTAAEPIFSSFKTLVTDVFDVVGDVIASTIGAAIDTLNGILDFLTGVFTGDWEKAWDGIKSAFSGIWNGMVGVLEGAVNLIISGLNFLIRALNKVSFDVPDWVPAIGGKKLGFNIQEIAKIEIPRLASGGVLTEPTTVLAGEYPGAANNPEIVAPQNILRETFAEAQDDTELLNAIYAIGSMIVKAVEEQDNGTYLDGKSTARWLYPYMKQTEREKGTSLVKGVRRV